MAAGLFTAAFAQSPLSKRERKEVVNTVVKDWNDWKTVSLSGKLKLDILPLSPGVKIFMQRDSMILISLRAPLMGEVGRAEIDSDSILVVNKMKKTYVKESIEKAFDYYPGTLSDIQDILLGRMVIPGFGLLSEETAGVVELFPEPAGGYSLLPGKKAELDGFNYGYLISPELRNAALAVVPVEKEGVIVGISYSYAKDKCDMTVSYQSENKNISGTLELDSPDWNSKGFAPMNINSRYRRMDFKQFMKSF